MRRAPGHREEPNYVLLHQQWRGHALDHNRELSADAAHAVVDGEPAAEVRHLRTHGARGGDAHPRARARSHRRACVQRAPARASHRRTGARPHERPHRVARPLPAVQQVEQLDVHEPDLRVLREQWSVMIC